MQQTMALIRGQLISIFTSCEAIIDDIIKHNIFDNEHNFNQYMPMLVKGDLTMSQKKELLKFCIIRKKALKEESVRELVDILDLVVDKRNHVAHWILDTSEEGIVLFRKTKTLRLIQPKRIKGKLIFDSFSERSLPELERKFHALISILIEVQNRIHNR